MTTASPAMPKTLAVRYIWWRSPDVGMTGHVHPEVGVNDRFKSCVGMLPAMRLPFLPLAVLGESRVEGPWRMADRGGDHENVALTQYCQTLAAIHLIVQAFAFLFGMVACQGLAEAVARHG